MGYVIGVDVGGTFTEEVYGVVLGDDGAATAARRPTREPPRATQSHPDSVQPVRRAAWLPRTSS